MRLYLNVTEMKFCMFLRRGNVEIKVGKINNFNVLMRKCLTHRVLFYNSENVHNQRT